MRVTRPGPFFFICLAGLLCLPAAGAELSASPSGGVNPTVGENAAVSFYLTGADAGISGFNITLAVSDPAVVSIAGISFADWVMLPVNSSPDLQEVFATGVDLNQQVQPGGASLPLLTIDLVGHAAGSATLTVTPRRIEDDLGGRYSPAALQDPVLVGIVAPSPTSLPTTTTSSPIANTDSSTSSSVQPTSPTRTTAAAPTYHSTDALPEGTGSPVRTPAEQPLNTTTPITSPTPSTPLPWVLPIASLAGLAGFRAWRTRARGFVGSNDRVNLSGTAV